MPFPWDYMRNVATSPQFCDLDPDFSEFQIAWGTTVAKHCGNEKGRGGGRTFHWILGREGPKNGFGKQYGGKQFEMEISKHFLSMQTKTAT